MDPVFRAEQSPDMFFSSKSVRHKNGKRKCSEKTARFHGEFAKETLSAQWGDLWSASVIQLKVWLCCRGHLYHQTGSWSYLKSLYFLLRIQLYYHYKWFWHHIQLLLTNLSTTATGIWPSHGSFNFKERTKLLQNKKERTNTAEILSEEEITASFF